MKDDKSLVPADLSITDFLALKRAESSAEGIYGYELREDYEFVGKNFNTGGAYRQLGRLAGYGFLSRNEEKEAPVMGPARRMFHITPEGQGILEEAAPIFKRLLGIEIV